LSEQQSTDEVPEVIVDLPEKVKRMPRTKGDLLYCSKCKRYRAKKHFSKNKASKDGYHGWCKDCSIAYSKAYQARKRAEREAAAKQANSKA